MPFRRSPSPVASSSIPTRAFYVKLWSNLTYNLSFYGSWDTRPPVTYNASDYGFSSGLGWSFGNPWTPQ